MSTAHEMNADRYPDELKPLSPRAQECFSEMWKWVWAEKPDGKTCGEKRREIIAKYGEEIDREVQEFLKQSNHD